MSSLMFLVCASGEEPVTIITNDADGPRDQATLYDLLDDDDGSTIQVFEGDVFSVPFRVYDSLDAYMRETAGVSLIKEDSE